MSCSVSRPTLSCGRSARKRPSLSKKLAIATCDTGGKQQAPESRAAETRPTPTRDPQRPRVLAIEGRRTPTSVRLPLQGLLSVPEALALPAVTFASNAEVAARQGLQRRCRARTHRRKVAINTRTSEDGGCTRWRALISKGPGFGAGRPPALRDRRLFRGSALPALSLPSVRRHWGTKCSAGVPTLSLLPCV